MSCALRVLRSNSSTSNALSSALTAWLMADCARPSFRAAPEKLPWSHTATNARSWLMVTLSSTDIQKIDRIQRYFVNCIDASSDPDRSGSRLERPARSIPALKRIIVMSYAIIGFGSIGQALAGAFARNNIEVTVASRRPPEALLPQAPEIGRTPGREKVWQDREITGVDG